MAADSRASLAPHLPEARRVELAGLLHRAREPGNADMGRLAADEHEFSFVRDGLCGSQYMRHLASLHRCRVSRRMANLRFGSIRPARG